VSNVFKGSVYQHILFHQNSFLISISSGRA